MVLCAGFVKRSLTISGKVHDISYIYTEASAQGAPYHVSGELFTNEGTTYHGVLRSNHCLKTAITFVGITGVCSACSNIPNKAFKRKVTARAKTTQLCAQTRNDNLTREAAIVLKTHFVSKFNTERNKNYLLALDLVRAQARLVSQKDRMVQDAKRGDLRALVHRLQTAQEEGEAVNNTLTRQLILDAAHNMNVLTRGADYTPATHGFWHVVRLWGSPKLYNFLVANMTGPKERTVKTWLAKSRCPVPVGLTDAYFEWLAHVYENEIKQQKINVPDGEWILTLAAEDETSIIDKLFYNQAQDTVSGACGLSCEQGCARVQACECANRHQCDPAVHLYVIGNDDGAYDRLVTYLSTVRVGTMARAIMLNPLLKKLSRMVVLYTPTCNSFTAADYVWPQWKLLRELFSRHLTRLRMLLIGGSSDGDRRRAALQMAESRSKHGERYGLNVPGFTHTALKLPDPGGDPNRFIIAHAADQDYLHNGKKVWNAADHDSRALQLGPSKHARLRHLDAVVASCDAKEYGYRKDDLRRKGILAMDVASMLRVLSKRAISCTERLVSNESGDGRGAHLQGMLRLQCLLRRYFEIFLSDNVQDMPKVQSASYVCFYLRIWRMWVHKSKLFTLKEHFITREAFQDMVSSCHFGVVIIMGTIDLSPSLDVELRLVGSDCVEVLWSSLGSQVMNKRSYCFGESQISIANQNEVNRVRAEGLCQFPRVNKKLSAIWDDDEAPVAAARACPTQADIENAWIAGFREAQADAEIDGMKPEASRGRGASSDTAWFDAPWLTETEPAKEKALQKLMRSESEDQREVDPQADVDVDLTVSELDDLGPPAVSDLSLPVVGDLGACAQSSLSPVSVLLKEILLRKGIESADEAATEILQVIQLDSVAIQVDAYAHFPTDGTFQLACSMQTSAAATAASVAVLAPVEPFTISLGKVHTPNHYFLLDTLGSPLVSQPLVRGEDGLYYGCVQVVGLNSTTFLATVTDLGQYPWGTVGTNHSTESKGLASTLAAVCSFLGIDGKSGCMNRCAATHILAALFRGQVLRLSDVCTRVDSAGAVDADLLPGTVLDTIEDVLTACDAKISPTLLVPSIDKRVYKHALIREFNEARGATRVSADRLVRFGQGQAQRSVLLANRASAAVATHTCALFDDIAIKFTVKGKIGAEYGRVVRMRKKTGTKWLDYNNAVDLNNRDAVANLFIVCYYYRKIEQSDRSILEFCGRVFVIVKRCIFFRFAYDLSWNDPVSIDAIICPVVVTYHHEEKNFSICPEHVALAEQSVAGVEKIF